ncbi:MAG: TonB-dependent receptor [Acidobacteriaceae bacterium]|nr:TonB-dependent receptor [Acidobacteriaceae bacterium]
MRPERWKWVAECVLAAVGLLSGCGTAHEDVAAPQILVGESSVRLDEVPLRDAAWSTALELDAGMREATVAERSDDPDHVTAAEVGRGQVVDAASGLSAAGLATTANSVTLDGLSALQSFRAGTRGAAAGGIRTGAMFGVGAVQSVRVMPRSFAADAAGAGGAIAVSTRGGGERLHGAMFALTRQSVWAATNPYSLVTRYNQGAPTLEWVKPKDANVQLGGSVGGPLAFRGVPSGWRRKVNAFGSLELQWRSFPVVASPESATFFALSATQRALLGTRGVSVTAANSALEYVDSLLGEVPRSSTRVLGFARLDARLSERDRLTVGFVGNRFSSPAGTYYASRSDAVMPRGRGSVGDATVEITAWTGAWIHRFSRAWGNDLRGQWARDLEFEQPRAPLAQEPAVGPGGYAPQVSMEPEGFAYGTPASLGRTAYPDEHRVQLADTLSWQRGRVLWRVGGDWSRVQDRIASTSNVEGTFRYSSGETSGKAGGFVDWITDYTFNVNAYPNAACPSITASVHRFCFSSYTQSFGAQQTEFATHEVAGFADTSWQATKRLSVNAGVRGEYVLLPVPQQPNSVLNAALRQLEDERVGSTAVFPEDRNNFGPRVGAVWRAPLGLSVRAGYGVFFGRLPGAMLRAALTENALATGIRTTRITPKTEVLCPQSTTVSFGYPCSFVTAPPGAVAQTARAMVFSQRFRLPAVQRFTLSVERPLGKRWSLQLAYAGVIATQLPGSVDLNVSPVATMTTFQLQGGDGWRGLRSGEMFAVPMYATRRLSGYGPITAITSRSNATFHALEANVHGRWRTLQVRGSYAWSHAMDYNPLMGATPRTMTQFDPFHEGYDKGRSALDYTHHFAGAMVWRTASRAQVRWRREVLSGWTVSAIGTAGSGAPYSYMVDGGSELSGGSESMNGAGGARYLPTVGRNTLRLPARGKLDLRLSRGFALGSRCRVEGFAEGFNMLNSRNSTSVETRAFLVGDAANGVTPLVFQDAAALGAEGEAGTAFGQVTSSTSGLTRERQVEFGVRVMF